MGLRYLLDHQLASSSDEDRANIREEIFHLVTSTYLVLQSPIHEQLDVKSFSSFCSISHRQLAEEACQLSEN